MRDSLDMRLGVRDKLQFSVKLARWWKTTRSSIIIAQGQLRPL